MAWSESAPNGSINSGTPTTQVEICFASLSLHAQSISPAKAKQIPRSTARAASKNVSKPLGSCKWPNSPTIGRRPANSFNYSPKTRPSAFIAGRSSAKSSSAFRSATKRTLKLIVAGRVGQGLTNPVSPRSSRHPNRHFKVLRETSRGQRRACTEGDRRSRPLLPTEPEHAFEVYATQPSRFSRMCTRPVAKARASTSLYPRAQPAVIGPLRAVAHRHLADRGHHRRSLTSCFCRRRVTASRREGSLP